MNTILDESLLLQQKWAEYHKRNPRARTREIAHILGVSEAALLSTKCGTQVRRLDIQSNGVLPLLQRAGALGRVMALTRNEYCVHERKGVYGQCDDLGFAALIQGEEIDLRLFFGHWHHAFAVQEDSASLQFFDANGDAVHKIHLLPESNHAAFEEITEDFRDPIQEYRRIKHGPSPTIPASGEIDLQAFRTAWQEMQDTHDFPGLLRKFGVSRTQALTLIGEQFSRPVNCLSAEALLAGAAETQLSIMVFVGNPGAIQIHTGPVTEIVLYGSDREWINILDSDFNLHLCQTGIGRAWVVRKPTRDGIVTSVEFYDSQGELIVQFFGRRKPGEKELEQWRELAAFLR